MQRFPPDFSELLSARGRRVLSGRDELCGALSRQRFVASTALLDAKKSRGAVKVLERAFADQLVPLERVLPSPDAAIESHGDKLPKTARMLTTPMEGDTTSTVYARAESCGLVAMMASAAYHDFVQALCGRIVEGPATQQVLCYRPGDYAGPHTDHHPQEEAVRGGYTDVHLTFCTVGVTRQLLVYERERHLSEVASITAGGSVTAYRLPFWHYTTPLEGRASARRWVVLGTFIDVK